MQSPPLTRRQTTGPSPKSSLPQSPPKLPLVLSAQDAEEVVEASDSGDDEVYTLNVGGRKFMTTRSTLCAESGSMLAAKFSGRYAVKKDKENCVFLDRSGEYFEHILNWLRMGRLPQHLSSETVDLLTLEADYYNLTRLLEALKQRQQQRHEVNAFVKLELVMSMESPGIPHALVTDLSCSPPARKMVPSNSRSSPAGYIYDSQIVITEGLQYLESLGWKVVRFHPELSVTEDRGAGGLRSYVYLVTKPRGATLLSIPQTIPQKPPESADRKILMSSRLSQEKEKAEKEK